VFNTAGVISGQVVKSL